MKNEAGSHNKFFKCSLRISSHTKIPKLNLKKIETKLAIQILTHYVCDYAIHCAIS